MDIIPAIDIIGGACVRLSQGDYALKKEYASDPLEMAKRFEDHGLERLHLVDLEGAKGGTIVNLQLAEFGAHRQQYPSHHRLWGWYQKE